MNVCDSDRLREAMFARGWREAGSPDEADFVIFMTCSVRDKAEQKAMSELGKFKRAGASARVALLGCMAARIGESVAKKFPFVRVVAGPRSLGAVPEAIDDSFATGRLHIIREAEALELSCVPTPRGNPHKAYVTISNGCDQFCAYCIVPYVRGGFESRAPDEILREVSSLVGRGVVEITLLGQNVNTYGRDFARGGPALPGYRFSNLLADVSAVEGLRRLRFTTSHPIDFTDDVIDAMVSAPAICPGVNLPVQAGSDKVLREMNRGYTRDEYLALVGRIRAALPGVALTTDLIVGFPGETEEEFEQSVDLLERVRFDLAHTAAYSPREGTVAASRTDQVPLSERARRLVRVNEAQTEISREINKSHEGKIFEILLDEPALKGEGLFQGRTATDKVVLVKAGPGSAGEFRRVRVTGSSPWCLEGELL
jgi:tRNA-2-methylthio-N6-dimethylallyladenosine synthase